MGMVKLHATVLGHQYFPSAKYDEASTMSKLALAGFYFLQVVGLSASAVRLGLDDGLSRLVVIVNILHICLVMRDPGYLPVVVEDKSSKPTNEAAADESYCAICNISRPERARHCKRCGRCVARFDHHCYWLHNCVGARTHALFLLYVGVLFYAVWRGTGRVYDAIERVDSGGLDAYITHNIFQLIVLSVGVMSALFLFGLFWGHVGLAVVGTTTWEFVSAHKIWYLREHENQNYNPYDAGPIWNCFYFCVPPSYLWNRRERRGGAVDHV
eukprot:PhM_4_TR3110/c1_g1_i4/m.35155/K18932/ZDHHC; palmitoyltransferase